jgi:hypothetical protein
MQERGEMMCPDVSVEMYSNPGKINSHSVFAPPHKELRVKRSLLLGLTMSLVCLGLQAQEISPYFFGQNHWLANGDEGRVGYVHLLWPQVKASGVKTIRIGGNSYNHAFPDRQHLTDAIDSIRAIGAEPILQVPSQLTALQAMELVEYYTKAGAKKVQYWSIGNEPLCEGKTTVDKVHGYILRIATAMKKVDPTIKIFVFDECYVMEAAYRDLCGGKFDLTGLKENGVWLIDGFNFHRYPFGEKFCREDVVLKGFEDILKEVKLLKQIMAEADKKHGRTGSAKLLWAMTELNVTYANPNREISGYGNPSFLGGQFMAESFGICMQYGAFTVNQWCINESDAVNTDFGYLGSPREFYPRSSYYHMQMMAQNMGNTFLTTADNQTYVKTVGSKSDKQICVLVMNEDQAKDFEFDIILDKSGTSTKALVVNADASLNKRITGIIENQTTMLFVFDATGALVKQITYGLKHNLAHKPPEVKTMQ